MSSAMDDFAEEGVDYLVDTGETTAAGDLVEVTGLNEVTPLAITGAGRGVGLAKAAHTAGQTVKVLQDGEVLAGVLSGATPGARYYWNGSGLTATIPSGSGNRVWAVGVAKNADDLHIKVEFVKKNS